MQVFLWIELENVKDKEEIHINSPHLEEAVDNFSEKKNRVTNWRIYKLNFCKNIR